jgi:hypothetical protein
MVVGRCVRAGDENADNVRSPRLHELLNLFPYVKQRIGGQCGQMEEHSATTDIAASKCRPFLDLSCTIMPQGAAPGECGKLPSQSECREGRTVGPTGVCREMIESVKGNKAKTQGAARSALLSLMSLAFIDIRTTAFCGKHMVELEDLDDSERIRILADLFHNIPGMINDAEKGDGGYQSILDQLWQWNRAFGQPWLDGALGYSRLDRSSSIFNSWTSPPV